MFFVIWYEGRHENVSAYETEKEALAFIDWTGLDPDELEIVQGEYGDF
jgi:hypothetical protein